MLKTFFREWKNRDVQEGKEFAILTSEISKATFGKTVEQHKELKGLKKENLRDHMTDLEPIFNMLGETLKNQRFLVPQKHLSVF